MKALEKQWVMIGISSLFLFFIVTSLFDAFYYSKITKSSLITEDMTRLQDIFMRIHKTCRIIDFDYQKNPINFLNVKSFVSSEVGPMNLAYPDKWQGPYVKDNPTMQAKEYQIVHTKKGYFITPGEGVKLPNGKIIGTDIMLDENANIARMAQDPEQLQFKGLSLAVKLDI